MNYFVDTNFFIQCKHIAELDWTLITESKQLCLYISTPVVDEIDRFKQDVNKRRQKRARDTNSLFREILDSGGNAISKKINDMEVTYRVDCNPSPAELREMTDILDLSRADNRIVASLLAFIRRNPSTNASLLTHDTGPMYTARNVGVPYVMIPKEWIVQPEDDSQQQEINRLKKKLAELAKHEPEVSISLSIDDVPFSRDIVTHIPLYRDLSETELDEYSEIVFEKYPEATFPENQEEETDDSGCVDPEFARTVALLGKLRSPSDEKIRDYQAEYSSWRESVREFLSLYPRAMSEQSRFIPFTVKLENTGSLPLDGAVMKIAIIHGGVLCPPTCTRRSVTLSPARFPHPPEPPKSIPEIFENAGLFQTMEVEKQVRSILDGPKMPDLSMSIHRDKALELISTVDNETFVFVGEKPLDPVHEFVLRCEEVRHKEGARVFSYESQVTLPIPAKLVFEVTISARNMRDPYRVVFPVTCKQEKKDLLHEIQKAISSV